MQSSERPEPLFTSWELGLELGLRRVISNVYGEEEGASSLSETPDRDRPGFLQIDKPSQSQGVGHFQSSIFNIVENLLRVRLEADYLELELEQNDISLLKNFIRTWKKYTIVISWLKRSAPQLSETPKDGSDKSMEQCLLELYTMIIMDKISPAVLEATFRIIQLERNGKEIEKALMRSVSVVFYDSQQMQWSPFHKMWQEPILRHFSHIYFQVNGSWIKDEAIAFVDLAITQACERVAKFFPSPEVGKRAMKMLKGIGAVQVYKQLNEMLADNLSEMRSILMGRVFEELLEMYDIHYELQNLRFVRQVVLGHHIDACLEMVGTIIKQDTRKWFLENRLKSTDRRINSVCTDVSLYAGQIGFLPLCHSDDISEQEQWYVRKKQKFIGQTLAEIVYNEFMGTIRDENSEVSLILKRNNAEEIHRMYQVLLHLFSLPGLFTSVLGYQVERKWELIWGSVRQAGATGNWSEGSWLLRIDSAIEEIKKLFLLRWGKGPQCTKCEKQDRIWPNHFGRNLHSNTELEQELEPILRGFGQKLVSEIFEYGDSKFLQDLTRNDLKEVRLFCEHASSTKHLKFLRTFIRAFVIDKGTEDYFSLVKTASQNWFQGEYFNRILSGTEQALKLISLRLYQLEPTERPADSSTWNTSFSVQAEVARLRTKFLRIATEQLQKMLGDENSRISLHFRHNNAEEVDRIYETCANLKAILRFGTSRIVSSDLNSRMQTLHLKMLLQFEVTHRSNRIWELIESMNGEWFKDNNLVEIDSEITTIRNLIDRRCGLNKGLAEEAKKRFSRYFSLKFDQRKLHKWLKSAFKLFDVEEIMRVYRVCLTLVNVELRALLCMMVVDIDIRMSGQHFLTIFRDAMRADQAAPGQNNGSQTLAALGKYGEGTLLRHNAGKELVKSLALLHSRCSTVKAALEDDRTVEDVIKESFFQIINLSLCLEEQTVTEVILAYIDGVMREKAGFQLQIVRDMIGLLSYSRPRENIRIISEGYLAKRLLLSPQFSKPITEDLRIEQVLISYMQEEFGKEFVVNLQAMVNDCATALEAEGEFSKYSEAEQQRNSKAVTVTNIRTFSNKIWPQSTEVPVKVPGPLANSLSQYEEYYKRLEPRREVKYLHWLGEGTIETSLYAGHGRKTTEIIGSVYQVSVLLLFHSQDKIRYEEILDALREENLGEADDMRRSRVTAYASVRSLLLPDTPLLKKEPDSEQIKGQDVLSINDAFTSRERTIRLPMPSARLYEEGLQLDKKSLKEGMKFTNQYDETWLTSSVKAAVLKVMKQKREEEYSKVFQDVVKYGDRFGIPIRANRRLFKEVVDKLIDMEYLTRDEEDNTILLYVPN